MISISMKRALSALSLFILLSLAVGCGGATQTTAEVDSNIKNMQKPQAPSLPKSPQ